MIKFRIDRKLNNQGKDCLIIQIKKWWYFKWRDLYVKKGDEYNQVEFPIVQYLKAVDFIDDLKEYPEKLTEYYTIIPTFSFMSRV